MAWLKLSELEPGLIFITRDGVLAVKSEYMRDSRQSMCILLLSGEYAHFADGDNTEVSPMELKGPNGEPC